MEGKKEFKYTIVDRKTQTPLFVQEVIFGSKKRPFPKDWEEQPIVIMGLEEHKTKFLQQMLEVKIEEL